MNIVREQDDFEDVLQYICAKKGECIRIVAHKKGFYRGEIELISSG